MNKIDHLVINVDEKLQKDASTIELIRKNGFPYEPKKGKKTKGFRLIPFWNKIIDILPVFFTPGLRYISTPDALASLSSNMPRQSQKILVNMPIF